MNALARRLTLFLAVTAAATGCSTRTRVVASTQDEVVMRVRVRAAETPPAAVAEEEPEVDLTCTGPGPDGLAVTSLGMGYAHACLALSDGSARCWGAGNEGPLGNGSRGRTATPSRVEGLEGVRSIGAGRMHSCALDERGRVFCWGGAGYRQVGFPLSGSSTDTPGEVVGLRNVAQLSVGSDHNCAVTRQGQVYCWGRNHNGQVGDGSRDRHERPVVVPRLRATQVAAGFASSCAVTNQATVACWGAIADGPRPTVVAGLPGAAVDVVVGQGFACARLVDGSVHCWGDGTHGQLGPANRSFADEPVRVEGLPPVNQLTAWGMHTCATDAQGGVWCWGSDEPNDPDGANPTTRGMMGPAQAVAIGTRAACARLVEGGLCCWGSNVDGLLGATNRPFSNPAFISEVPVPMAW